MKKKIFIILLTVSIILSMTVVPVFAADSYGTKVQVEMRYNDAYFCISPADVSYYYYYILYGNSGDFGWIDSDYILIWSKERLIVSDNKIVMSEPFLYVASDSLENLIEGVQNKDNVKTLDMYQSKGTFEFKSTSNFRVIFSNNRYEIDGEHYSAKWFAATAGTHSEILKGFLMSTYQALKNNHIVLFGSEISFWSLLAGPFVITVGILVLNSCIGVGDASAQYGIGVAKNIRRRVENEERWQARRKQIQEERAARRSRGK